MVIAEGPAAIFKFSLAILLSKKEEMMSTMDGFEHVADYIKNQLNDVNDVNKVRSLVESASKMKLGNRLDIYATEYAVLSENDLLREPGQNWSPSKNIVKDLRWEFFLDINLWRSNSFLKMSFRIQNRKLKEKVSIQDTQIQALQDSLKEIQDEALRQKENTRIMAELALERDELTNERNDLKELVKKLSEQLGNLSAEQSTFNSRNSTPS